MPGQCVDWCVVVELDKQSGDRPTGAVKPYLHRTGTGFTDGMNGRLLTYEKTGDSGGCSRFFPQFWHHTNPPTTDRRTTVQLIHGDCLDALRTLPDHSVDAVVTDPPAGIAFMGKAWDGDKGGRDQWIAWLAERLTECLRVLKPGGHAVVWALPRTSGWTHRALEDAGFDVRDCVHHLFGSGFPKSLDVGKAIDKRPGISLYQRFAQHLTAKRQGAGLSRADVSERVVGSRSGACWNWEHHQFPEARWWPALRDLLGLDDEWAAIVAEADREVIGTAVYGDGHVQHSTVPPGYAWATDASKDTRSLTAPATPEAQQWDGWGTALKPAVEHWWLARKPLDSTVAGTVCRWGTGALNIDATRVTPTSEKLRMPGPNGICHDYHARPWMDDEAMVDARTERAAEAIRKGETMGRWPADVLLSHSAECDGVCSPGCAVAELDRQSGTSTSTPHRVAVKGRVGGILGVEGADRDYMTAHGDSGGASRFFPTFKYQAKPSTREKGQGLDDRNTHPTVKPVELMRWLVRLVTPPGGIVLDPFAGSGSTLVAATLEGFDSIGVEAEAEYLPLIEGRVRWAEQQAEQPALSFD